MVRNVKANLALSKAYATDCILVVVLRNFELSNESLSFHLHKLNFLICVLRRIAFQIFERSVFENVGEISTAKNDCWSSFCG